MKRKIKLYIGDIWENITHMELFHYPVLRE
jgi:hypothetical protein